MGVSVQALEKNKKSQIKRQARKALRKARKALRKAPEKSAADVFFHTILYFDRIQGGS